MGSRNDVSPRRSGFKPASPAGSAPGAFNELRCERIDSASFSADFVGLVKNGSHGSASIFSLVDRDGQVSVPALDGTAEEQHPDEAEALARSFEQGRKAGFQEALAFAEKQNLESYGRITGEIELITSQLSLDVEARIQKLERAALELAVGVARKVVGETIKTDTKYIRAVIRRGLENVGGGTPLAVRVSSRDFKFLSREAASDGKDEKLKSVRIIEDTALGGGCVIETDYGSVNLDVEAMWSEVEEKLRRLYKP